MNIQQNSYRANTKFLCKCSSFWRFTGRGMFTMKLISLCLVFSFLVLSALAADETVDEMEQEHKEEDMKHAEYQKGSLCGYCDHCKFCVVCDEQCPCETSPSQPNCHLCKYCKYCYLCSSICDTVCTPGGILDRVTAALVNSLPTINTDEVDEEIDMAKTWIDKKSQEMDEDRMKDEL